MPQTVTMISSKLKCRICLIDYNQNQLLYLFSKNEHSDDAALTNADLIMACSSVHINIKDGLPQHLCLTCYQKLSELYEFKQLCETSDKILHNSITVISNDDSKYSLEPLELTSVADVDVKYEVHEHHAFKQHQDEDHEDDPHFTTAEALEATTLEDEADIKMEYVCTTCPQRFNDENAYFNHLDNCPPLVVHHKPESQKTKIKQRKKIKNDLNAENQILKEVKSNSDMKLADSMYCYLCKMNVLNSKEVHMKLMHSKTSCFICLTSFKTLQQLQDHQIVTHQHRNDITKSTNNNDNDGVNINNNNNNNKEQCPLCNEYFTNLIRHHNKVHKINKCTICNKTFIINRYFIRHMKRYHYTSSPDTKNDERVTIIDTTNNKNLCPYCGRAFKELGNLKQHIRIHTGEKPYECEFCPKKFAQWSSLRSHRVVHTGEKNYACEICGKAFSRLVTLNKHLTSHSDERNYPCDICGRKFKHSRSVKEHMVIHTGIKSHKCTYCDKCFGFKKNLVVHLRTHTGVKPYQCELCKQAFTQRHCLRAHMKSHHKQQL